MTERLIPTPPGASSLRLPRRNTTRTWVLLCGVGTLVGLTFVIGRSNLFSPGDDIGYYLGLSGALMMLSLLAYPLRKNLRVMRTWGAMRQWLRIHVLLGISGPLLILTHSTYHLRTLNATIALASMLLVAASGFVGRFIYVRIHNTLTGQRETLQNIRERAGLASSEVQSVLDYAPEVKTRLMAFEATLQLPLQSPWRRCMRFLTLQPRTWWLRRQCTRVILKKLSQHATVRQWDTDKLSRRQDRAKNVLRLHLDALISVAQFTAFERLFALWHIVHVPFLYLLAASAVVHVLAVHMY
ncbi:hypothetical protein [Uliginosibacterium gangwonense]|uniref:hypothetical protein n=1 Tax=Uliginosibacterium gangwonense TaxID=392736 RepID=UPI00039CD216|nr:hypothetical protein [Uliginosibacterium gangwonense]